MKHLLSVILCVFCFAPVSKGQTYTIKGIVADTLTIQRLYMASVTVIGGDSVIAAYTRADTAGDFALQVPRQGKYTLLITYPGFADYTDTINVTDQVTDVGMIPMTSKEHLLQEFVITRQIAAIKIKGDTTEYVADSFKVKDNANVQDLLRKLPGIQVDKNGQITAQGETVQKVLVDGEEFFSDDPKVVTQGLQANIVDKVQVYDKKSDQAQFTGIDDGQKIKTINLELKENKKKGFFGKADAGGGTGGYFQNQLMVNAFKGKRQLSAFGINSNTDKVGLGWQDNSKFGSEGIMEATDNGMNIIGSSYDEFGGWSGTYSGDGLPKVWTGGIHFADKWNEEKSHLSANYRYAMQQVEADGNSIAQYALSGDSARINAEEKHQFSKGERQGFDGFYEWKTDTNTSLRLIADAGVKNSDISSLYETRTWNKTPEGDGDTTLNNRSFTTHSQAQFVNADFLFRKKFAKKGRTFSLSFKENYNDTKGQGNLRSSIVSPGHPADSTDQQKVNNSNNLALNSKATYTEPLSETAYLELNYGVAVNNNTALNYSYNKAPGSNDYTDLNDTFSSNFRYNFLSNRGGLNFKFVYKKMNFSFGSDASQTNYLQTDLLHGDTSHRYSYLNLYPRAVFSYSFAKRTAINFFYEGSTKQPTISQVQPLNQNTDLLNITTGNPYLKQSFTNKFNVRFNDYKVLTGRWLWSSVNFSSVANDISTSQTTDGPVSTTKYVNVAGDYNFNWYFGYGFKIKKLDLNTGLTIQGSSNHVNNFINNERNPNDNNSYTIGPNFSYDKEDKYNFSIDPSIVFNDNRSKINSVPTNYWVFNTDIRGEVQLPKKFEIGTTVNIMIREQTVVFTGNNQVIKWNASISKKLTKKGNVELKAVVYDILNQNVGYTRTAQGSVITQNNYNTIRRYGMFSVVWNFTHTPVAETPQN